LFDEAVIRFAMRVACVAENHHLAQERKVFLREAAGEALCNIFEQREEIDV